MLRELLSQIARLFTWVLMVSPWEQALRVRAGKHVKLLHAGAHLRIPFIDRVFRQSVRRRLCTIPPQTVTTADGKTITIGALLGYSIVDLLKLYQTLHDAHDTIEAEASAAVADYVATHDLCECRPLLIQEWVLQRIDLMQYGLSRAEFRISCFAVVRTLRLITGNLKDWNDERLNTRESDEPVNRQSYGYF